MRLVFVFSILLLIGCDSKQSSYSVFDNYLYRLSNSLDVERESNLDVSVSQVTQKLAVYPKKSVLAYKLPPLDINVLQFLQLSQCDLQRLVGERNSSLGKLISGYHSLLYEYEFLVLAKECLQAIDNDSALYTELTKAIDYKERYQDRLRWNATLVSEELRHLFLLGSQPLTPEQLFNKPVDLIEALTALNVWLSKPTADVENLQQAYQVFETRKYIGELRLALAIATVRIIQADALISKRLSKRPLCFNQQPNKQFEIVNRVFTFFYIGEVQPMLAQLHQQGQELFGLIDDLQVTINSKSVRERLEFDIFWDEVYKNKSSEWNRYKEAVSLHTQSWQKLLDQCGRLPS